MAFGFDPSIILATRPSDPSEGVRTLSHLLGQAQQRQESQARLADLLRQQQRQQGLADIYSQNAGSPDVIPGALLQEGYGNEGLQWLAKQADIAAKNRMGLPHDLSPEDAELKRARAEYLRRQPQRAADPEKQRSLRLRNDKLERDLDKASSGGDLNKVADALRKEMNLLPEVKAYSQVRPYFQNLKAADDINRQLVAQGKPPSGAGDLNFIFNFMKLLDPGVAVMEGDVANAQNAGGVPDKIRALYNQVNSGGRLSEEQRADFMRQAEALYGTREKAYTTIANRYRGFASKRGASPDDVAPSMGADAATKAIAAPKGKAKQAAGGLTPEEEADLARLEAKYGGAQ